MVCPFLEKCPKAHLFCPSRPTQFVSRSVRTPFPIETLVLLLLGLLLLVLPLIMAPSEPKIMFVPRPTAGECSSLVPTKENVDEE